MGAEFDYRVYKTTDIAAAKKSFKDDVEEALYDYGHAGYTGTIAEKDPDDIAHYCIKDDFDTVDEAVEVVREQSEKWGPAVLVKTKDSIVIGGWCSS